MKKLILILFFIPLVISLNNCEPENPYAFSIDAKNGADTKKEVDFRIQKTIIDSLNHSKYDVVYMAKKAALYADWDVKNKLTYDFQKESAGFIYFSDGVIKISIDGQAKNSYGVPSKFTTVIEFDAETREMILNKDGFPDVITIDL